MKTPNPELGPYRLDALLGRGGMGEVYRAWDERLQRWVAVKRLIRKSNKDLGERFRREARAAARLGHPAVIQVFDVLEGDGDDWIVMEMVDGPDLATLVADGPLDIGLVLDIGRQVAEGLAAAHSAGILHCDLKTENVMLLPSGHAKVLDFGLARSYDGDETGSVEKRSRVAGTPRCMSPEQARGERLSPQSDLFSLGVLLYELLTGRSPFAASTVNETVQRVLKHHPPPVRRLRPAIPEELSDLVGRLLYKPAKHRPADAHAVADELAGIASTNRLYTTTLEGANLDDATTLVNDDSVVIENAVIKVLLVSDLVDSTKLIERLGDRGAAEIGARHDRVARDLLGKYDGLEIDKTDGFLLLFDRPWNAVRYALDYHRALRNFDDVDVVLRARVGIHLGEVILRRNPPQDVARGAKPIEVEGLAKPMAARLMSLAGGGQTLLTRGVYDVALRSAVDEENSDLCWLEHGPYHFKGIASDVDVYEVGIEGAHPGMNSRATPKGRPTGFRAKALGTGSSAFPALAGEPEGRLSNVARGFIPGRDDVTPAVAKLRHWPPPELPEQPYPVLLPYTHPALMAGRDDEIEDVRLRLQRRIPILGLGAPSGTGKSSFLLGGLVPNLRSNGNPVTVIRHPREPGIAKRLLGDLLEETTVDDDDWRSFVERLNEVERLSGEAPLLVLDQFEDILTDDAAEARKRLGVLMAATAQRRPGIGTPLCRWLLAYRNEYHGEVLAWLEDVLVDGSEDDGLPHNLADPERFQSFALSPLGTVRGHATLDNVRDVFLEAIEKPLRHYDLEFVPGHAERLAQAFAESRLARPDAPLAPELQVVLAHILATSKGDLEVPENAEALVDEALTDHLRRALESVFPSGGADAALRRARALLALRELATSTGQRDEGILASDLARAIGEDGHAILQALATPLTRLLVLQDAPDGMRYTLSHDQMAAAIVRMFVHEGRQGRLLVDAELLALRRFVSLKTALHQAQRNAKETLATRIPRHHYRDIAANTEALLWDDERYSWWAACQRQRRADLQRKTWTTAAALIFLILVSWFTYDWVREREQLQALQDTIVQGQPEEALQALHRLNQEPGVTDDDLLGLLRQRDVPMDVLERGLGGVSDSERSAVVLRTVALALPWVQEDPKNFVLIANLVWALDYSPGRDPANAAAAKTLRNRVLEPLRQKRPPPRIALDDPDWVDIPAGTFLMGSPEGVGRDDECPQHEVTVSAFRMQRHEVTNAEYRRLVPEHSGDDNRPAAYVSWYACATYAAWLGGRLPTEAEWEYTARAGCPHAYCTQDGQEATVDDVAWTLRNSRDKETGELVPSPIMSLEPNSWGLYDMLGNLWEWTGDWYAPYGVVAADDPQGPTSGGGRVDRGGCFGHEADVSRAAFRSRISAGFVNLFQGCRVVLSHHPER